MNFEQFPNAPVQEAIIDFRLTYKAPPTEESFSELAEKLIQSYPTKHQLQRHTSELQFGDGKSSTTHNSQFAGYRFESTERDFVFQAQVDGFTLSKLRPYKDWDNLVGETKRIWKIFRAAMKPVSIDRVACRYINRFEVRSGAFDLKDYFTKPPEIPDSLPPNDLPQGISRYLVQVEIPVPGSRTVALFTQALENVSDQVVSFLMDIDVFKVETYEIDEEKWWGDIDNLRTLKNQIFFASITEKTKDLFR
jgi:uncharacterized protein (TIGR04255 family)